jgi:hypothetical protein
VRTQLWRAKLIPRQLVLDRTRKRTRTSNDRSSCRNLHEMPFAVAVGSGMAFRSHVSPGATRVSFSRASGRVTVNVTRQKIVTVNAAHATETRWTDPPPVPKVRDTVFGTFQESGSRLEKGAKRCVGLFSRMFLRMSVPETRLTKNSSSVHP